MKKNILLIFIILLSCKTSQVIIENEKMFVQDISFTLDFENNENTRIIKSKREFNKLVENYRQNNYYFVVSYYRESYFSFGYLAEKELLLKKELIYRGIDTSKVEVYPFSDVRKYLNMTKLKNSRIFLVNNFVLEILKRKEGGR
jgi:hypothetical protein